MKQPHYIQIQILKNLLFADKLSYTKLKSGLDIENSKFDFHVKKLLEEDYIAKDNNNYILTPAGKEYASRIDTDNLKVTKQAKISVEICCTRNYNLDYLIYTRLKHPFYGCQGFMTGKVPYGEMVIEAAERELKEETGQQVKQKFSK